MARIAAFLLLALTLLGADTTWTRVKDLKSRAEMRIYKKGAREPVNATFYDATDDKVIVVVKNDQVAIARDEIDRIDARTVDTNRKVSVEHTEKEVPPDPVPRPNVTAAPPGSEYSSGVNVGGGSKSPFQTVYVRPAAAPKN